MSKQLFLSWLLIFSYLTVSAGVGDTFANAGINYNVLTESGNIGTVAVGDNSSYSSATVIIPNTITHSSITYTITSIGYAAFQKCRSLTEVTLPSGLTSIGDRAFYYTNLTSITFPSSLTRIGDFAFYACESLKDVTFPSGLTSIGNYVFGNCRSLKNVTFPSGLTHIGELAFYNTALTEITLPSSLISIGQAAFDSCTKLTKVITKVENPTTIALESIVFEGLPTTAKLYVPNATAKTAYEGAAQWQDFKTLADGCSRGGIESESMLSTPVFAENRIIISIVNQVLTVSAKDTLEVTELVMVSSLGSVVLKSNTNNVFVGHLATGVYIVKAVTNQGVVIKKVIK